MNSDPPTGVNLFKLLEEFQDDPRLPRHLVDVQAFEEECKKEGFHELHDLFHSWRIFLEYHVKAEWRK